MYLLWSYWVFEGLLLGFLVLKINFCVSLRDLFTG
uniref:Defective in cullin neddylation protein n=1 Tax=Rhizophora mucronata TaxID=61149 RepID=A0A2P2JQ44_RHIMU